MGLIMGAVFVVLLNVLACILAADTNQASTQCATYTVLSGSLHAGLPLHETSGCSSPYECVFRNQSNPFDIATCCELCSNHTGCRAWNIDFDGPASGRNYGQCWLLFSTQSKLFKCTLPSCITGVNPNLPNPSHYPTPAPTPPPKPPSPPSPPPVPPSQTWPSFSTLAALKESPWKLYFQAVYGELPTTFPVNTEDFWIVYDIDIVHAKANAPRSVGTCPTANPPKGQ